MKGVKGKRVIQFHEMEISAPAAKVFPLLCPERELDWVDGWSCDLIHSRSGVAENNCIFQTDRRGEGKRTWIVSRYEPDRTIEFVIFQHDSAIIKLDLELTESAGGMTNMKATHTITGLDENGNALVDGLPADFTRVRWTRLAEALNHYLRTGEMLKLHG